MRYLFLIATFLFFTYGALAQKPDVVSIQKQDLAFKYLQTGKASYLIYFKKTEDGPATNLTLVNIEVEPSTFNGRKAYSVRQKWYMGDSLAHTSYTVHDASDFSTLEHETWWKARGFTAKFNFATKQASFEGAVDEKAKAKIIEDFNQSFDAYNLNWHSDLTIFPLFPYKEGRTFKVNFYDPGAGKARIAEYQVKGSELLTVGAGEKIDTWLMEYDSEMPNGGKYVQRFWISKKSREVLKEEDVYPGGFRYKFKLGISTDN